LGWCYNTDSVTFQYGAFQLTCNDASATEYVVTVDGADFNTVTSYTLTNCNPAAQIVINIGGSSSTVTFQGNNIYQAEEQVIYNVLGSARTIQIETEVRGSILAPNNQYLQAGQGVVKGHVIVANIQQAHQINRLYCVGLPLTPPSPPVPTHYCPSFITDCAGLTMNLDGQSVSFIDYDVISFGDFNAVSGDVEGRLAVRNGVDLGAFSVGYQIHRDSSDNTLPYSVVVGHDCRWSSGAVYPDGSGSPYAGNEENIFCGGSFTGASYLQQRVTGSCENADCLDSAFNAAQQCYEGYQNTVANVQDNVAVEVYWSGLYLTCNDVTATSYTFSLTSSQMSQYTYIAPFTNCNSDASWTINIRGTDSVTLTGGSFPADCGQVVYNVIGSGRTITVTGTSLCGHLLAPDNILNQSGGVIVGHVIAGDIPASLQINKNPCN